jgi:hypothetical protein
MQHPLQIALSGRIKALALQRKPAIERAYGRITAHGETAVPGKPRITTTRYALLFSLDAAGERMVDTTPLPDCSGNPNPGA